MNKLQSRGLATVVFAALGAHSVIGLSDTSPQRAQSKSATQKALVIDGHRHVGDGGFLGDFPAGDLIAEMDRLGIDKTVILPMGDMPKTAEEDNRMLAEIEKANDDYFKKGFISDEVKKLQCARVDHAEIIRAIHQYPTRLVGVYMINPWVGEPELEAAEKAVRSEGFRGLKLHPQGNSFPADHEVVDPVLKLARRLGVPVMFHTSFGLGTEPARVAKVAARFPEVSVIMYHPGIGEFHKDAIKAARQHRNVYLDTAHAEPAVLQAFLEQVPPKQIFFGTDAPWGKWAVKFELVRTATESRPDVQRLIMGENIARLMGLRCTGTASPAAAPIDKAK